MYVSLNYENTTKTVTADLTMNYDQGCGSAPTAGEICQLGKRSSPAEFWLVNTRKGH